MCVHIVAIGAIGVGLCDGVDIDAVIGAQVGINGVGFCKLGGHGAMNFQSTKEAVTQTNQTISFSFFGFAGGIC